MKVEFSCQVKLGVCITTLRLIISIVHVSAFSFSLPTNMTVETKLKELIEELKNIRTIELACIAINVLERIFWGILGFLGLAWAFYFIPSNIQIWLDNPSIITKGEFDLSDIKYPAITIKPFGIPKYAITERLANYIKPDKLPIQLRPIRNSLFQCAMIENQEDEMKSDLDRFKTFNKDCLFNFKITKNEELICKVSFNNNSK